MKFSATLQGLANKVPNQVTKKIALSSLHAKKHSPVVLFGAGVIGITATVVLACRATLKLDEHVNETETRIKAIESNKDLTDKARHKEIVFVRSTAAIETAKLYGPSVLIGVASVFALTGSHVILTKRNTALGAAYAVLDRGMKEYRQRVIEKYGEEEDRDLRHGYQMVEVVDETEDGPVVSTVKRTIGKHSIYARYFDEGNKNWQRAQGYNQLFIQSQQQYANQRLHSYGYLFLNDVYESLGMPRTPEGQLVGWVMNGNGDSFVDFGVFRDNAFKGQLFVNGDERSVLLDFNVDGVVYDKI